MRRLARAAAIGLLVGALAACGQAAGGAAPSGGGQPSSGDQSGGDAQQGKKFPMVETTPSADQAAAIDSVTPTSQKPGGTVTVKGKRLAPVMCALPNEVQDQSNGIPPGPDPNVWLVPASGKPVMPFAFNDPAYTNGKTEDGEWTADQIDFNLPGDLAAGSYKLVVKTACGVSNAVQLQVTGG